MSGPTATQGPLHFGPFAPDSPLAQVSPLPGQTVAGGYRTWIYCGAGVGEAGTTEVRGSLSSGTQGFQPHRNDHILKQKTGQMFG